MNRRSFFRRMAGHVSGSFLLGTAGGATAGAVGMRGHDRRQGVIGNTSYAQQGEDLVLWNFCEHLHIDNPTYLDVGAYDPVIINNTYLFYSRGCRGVLVEPNPARWSRLESVRPHDRLLRAGIGTGEETEADFYVIGSLFHGGDDLSTFSKEEADAVTAKTNGRHYVEKVIQLPLLNINKVMAEHGTPNVVSIDVEGLDLAILKSVDFNRFRPDVFCVEAVEFGTHEFRPELVSFLTSNGYVFRGGTFINAIFMDSRHFA